MSARLIRVSSRETGERVVVRVYVYDDVEELRAACQRYSGENIDWDTTVGACQTFVVTDEDDAVVYRSPITVRLARGHLDSRVVTHEMCHAACEVYGRSLDAGEPVGEHLNNANEVLAHLHSDLTGAVVDRLYDLGYYERPAS